MSYQDPIIAKLFELINDRVDWSFQYDADKLPGEAVPEWNNVGVFTVEEISPTGILHIANEEFGYYNRDGEFSSSVGWTMEVRLRVVSVGPNGLRIYVGDDAHTIWIIFASDAITLDKLEGGTQEYEMDTTDGYHTYRITKEGTDVKLYIDDVLRLSGTANIEADENVIEFGNQFNQEQESYWDRLYYRTDGAFAPGEGNTIISYYYGDPFMIPRSNLPALIGSKDSTTIKDLTNAEDEHRIRIVLTLVTDIRDDFGDTSGIVAGQQTLSNIMEGRESDFKLKSTSITDILRSNTNLGNQAQISVTEEMVPDYGLSLGKRGENSISMEANLVVPVYFSQLRV